MRIIYTISLLQLLLMSCSDEPLIRLRESDFNKIDLTPGFHHESIVTGQGTMLYSLWVPPLPHDTLMPFVVGLHFAGPPSDHRSDDYFQALLWPGLKSKGAILFAPDVQAGSWIDPESELAVGDFVKLALKNWPIDKKRVIVTGYSMGGIGTWFVADKYSNLFTGAIPMASAPVGFLSGKIPHYIIQGRYDELFILSDVRSAMKILRENDGIATLQIVDRGHYEAGGYSEWLERGWDWIDSVNFSK